MMVVTAEGATAMGASAHSITDTIFSVVALHVAVKTPGAPHVEVTPVAPVVVLLIETSSAELSPHVTAAGVTEVLASALAEVQHK
jgi:hypothetical protein|tara:strand:- start:821 stop:1075 length:255 start_codon:yes stop_codon:yes gene_type:complete